MSIDFLVSLKNDFSDIFIPLRGFLQEIIKSYAGHSINVLYKDETKEETVVCPVNKQGRLMLNPALKELLKKHDITTFHLIPQAFPLESNFFLLIPLNRAEADRKGSPRRILHSSAQQNRTDRQPKAHQQLNLFPQEKQQKQKSSFPSAPASSSPKQAGSKRPTNKEQKQVRKQKAARVEEAAAARTADTLKAKKAEKEKAEVKTPALKQQQPGEIELAVKPSLEENPVEIRFSHAEAERLLAAAEKGQEEPPADLLLHREALLLSLSPGFDTLLSLSAVRDIEPLDYQLSAVRHVLKNLRGRALLCDEVGLGKTIEAGLVMMEYLLRGLVRRILVLTPPSLVEQWQEEMYSKFNLDFITYDHPEFKGHPRPWEHYPRIIASLDTAKRQGNQQKVLAAEYDLVIVDEAHHLKNHRTVAYQLVKQLKKKYILLLTATPVENNLEELFNLITLLLPGQLETAASFKRKYITRGNPLKPKNTGELKQLVREVMIRNRRSETGVILPRRQAEVVELDLSAEEMAFYRQLTSFVRRFYGKSGTDTGNGVNQFTLKTLQREAGSSLEAVLPTLEKLCSRHELPAELQETLELLLSSAREIPSRSKAAALLELLHRVPEKVVVFTSFRETQRFLTEIISRERLEVAELHGGMRRQQKEEQVKTFAEKARVLVSTDIGSEGRNLQFCHFIVNYDLPWNPMRIEQRIGRLHRLGQEKDVFIYNFSARETVEAYILELLDAKINMFQLVVGELDMILGNLNEKKDFETLIMEIWSRAQNPESLKADMEKLGERLIAAKKQYEAVRQLDDRLLGELVPHE